MATVSTADSQVHSAVEACASALMRITDYELEPSLQNRRLDLGERKEHLIQAEYEELIALVDFTSKRTIESLGAKIALNRVNDTVSQIDHASSDNENLSGP